MYPQRLPIVDDDDGVWGDILRKYLLKEHYDSGADSADNGGHKNVTIRAGTAGAGGAPLKFTSGTLLTAPEVGAVEFAGDNLYVTQTSSATRKKVALYDDASGATGDIYYRNSSGYFTPLAAGAASQILTISGGVPTWQTPTSTSTFTDSTFFLQDEGDTTKKAQFQLQSITTNTTRTLTIPNSNGTIYVTGGTDVSVADGGTGRSTATTAYGIIAAGTTATGAQQTISPGSSGQFLKSAGASALATFASITAADITGTTAQFNTALSDNDFATLAGNEILTNKTLTNPKIGTIQDTNGNTSLDIINNASAVNHVYINNQPTGTYPGIGVDGTDTNIGFDIIPKGTGAVRIYATAGNTPTLQAVGADTNINLNLVPKGTGTISASSGRIANVANPTGAQDAATKNYVDSAIATSTGAPYDLSIISFGTYTARVVNSYGDFPMGVKLQRAVTFTQVIYRVNTADASGNLVVQLRKNGSTVSGTSTTIAAANQVTGGTATGSWAFAAGDILTVYVTGVGTTPGAGLIADIKGSTT